MQILHSALLFNFIEEFVSNGSVVFFNVVNILTRPNKFTVSISDIFFFLLFTGNAINNHSHSCERLKRFHVGNNIVFFCLIVLFDSEF